MVVPGVIVVGKQTPVWFGSCGSGLERSVERGVCLRVDIWVWFWVPHGERRVMEPHHGRQPGRSGRRNQSTGSKGGGYYPAQRDA
jgi:hypothetical protein